MSEATADSSAKGDSSSTSNTQASAQDRLSEIILKMGTDSTLQGIHTLGKDGVLRSWDADRNIVDAVALTPDLIKALLDRFEYDGESETIFRGVDGTRVPREQWFNPPKDIIPPPLPEEHRERDEEVLERYRQMGRKRRAEIEAGTARSCPVRILSDNKIEE